MAVFCVVAFGALKAGGLAVGLLLAGSGVLLAIRHHHRLLH
jgi:hypothetical protein